MHLVYVPGSEGKDSIYEFSTYGKAKYFAIKHRSLGATLTGKAKAIDTLDLFCERVAVNGRKYRKKGVENETR